MTNEQSTGRPGEGGGSGGAAGAPGAGGGTVHIGSMSGGAVAAGYGARAVDRSSRGAPPTAGAEAELLAAVRTLRAQLGLLVPSAESAEVADELARVEEEITTTGQPDRPRLRRLRERLEAGSGAVGGLAAALAVSEAIGRLVG